MTSLEKEHRKLSDLLQHAQEVLVITHSSPDADGISACLAMRAALVSLGVSAHVVVTDPLPHNCGFLPGLEAVVSARAHVPRPDLIVSIDAGDVDLIRTVYDAERDHAIPLVNIDHHLTNTRFGTVNLVDAEAGASCEILYAVIKRLGVAIDLEIATCLLTGLVSDTQAFRTANTTARSLRVAADLVTRGAPLKTIVEEVVELRPLSTMRLLGLVLSRLQTAGSMIWAEITPEMLTESGATARDVDGISNLLSSIREAEVTVLFKPDTEGAMRVSVRTKGRVNAAEVCAAFGGGGHARAAGATIEAESLAVARERFLTRMKEALGAGG